MRQQRSPGPPDIKILQLTLQKRVYTKVGTSLGAAAQDQEISGLNISTLIRSQELKVFTDPQALIRVFGYGWTTEYLTKVMKLTAQQSLGLLRMAQTLTMGQIFALYVAFGQEAFKLGPITLLQRCCKCQSLEQTLTIMVLTWGQTRELLSLVKWIDRTVLGPKDTNKKNYFLAQVLDLHLIMTVGDVQVQNAKYTDEQGTEVKARKGVTQFGLRAFIMGALPQALASGFMAYVILTHDCYTAMWYPDVPMDWVALNEDITCMLYVVCFYVRKRFSAASPLPQTKKLFHDYC